MSLLFEQYLQHFEAARRALSDGRQDEGKAELLRASQCLLELARDTPDEELRQQRKQRGFKLLQMAQRLELPAAHPEPADDAAGERVAKTTHSPPRFLAVEKPGVYFKDVAGLHEVKDLLRRRVIYPFAHPELAQRYRRRPGGGVLLYGPPGTGKTMIAKAIATELDARFYSVSASDVLSKWVGEAEGNLRELFATARANTPAVIFFDETDALVPRRGGDSAVMSRLVPEFLAQVDGLRGGPPGLLLLGATNRPWDIDPAALRPGRFGEQVYVGLPDAEARRYILESTLARVPLDEDVSLEDLVAQTAGFSGADLNGLVDRIVDPAFAAAVERGETVAISTQHVAAGLARSRPSVSPADLNRYQQVAPNDLP